MEDVTLPYFEIFNILGEKNAVGPLLSASLTSKTKKKEAAVQ